MKTVVASGRKRVFLSRKEGQGTFWEDGHVLYLFRDLRYQTRCIYQNFSSDTLEIFIFHVCKLYLKKWTNNEF